MNEVEFVSGVDQSLHFNTVVRQHIYKTDP